MTIISNESDPQFDWNEVVAFSDLDGGFAYVPGRLLVGRDVDFDVVNSFAGEEDEFAPRDDVDLDVALLIEGATDPLRVVAGLRAVGLVAQPDHVFFAHSCECCCGPHPAELLANPVRANPVRANPVRANPVRANPVRANPLWANARPNLLDGEGPSQSSVVPAKAPLLPAPIPAGVLAGMVAPRILVLDTGLPDAAVGLKPALLDQARITGDPDTPDVDGDRWLDTVAGHGGFIAGIIERLAPGCTIRIQRVVEPFGYAVESSVIAAIVAEANAAPELRADFLNLSFGGPVWERAPALAAAIHLAQRKGIVVVASAGNEATCAPMYPAALPGVVSVGAVGPDGPAPFTNYGSWVRACAPGVDVVSSFFANWNGAGSPRGGFDPDQFNGWARWSGTSFAAPGVIAALVREMRVSGCTPQQAVTRLIDAPWLGRIPGLGTVVNI